MQEYTSMSKKAFWCFRLNTNTTKTLSGLNIKISTYLYERWVSTPYVRQLKKWSSDTSPYFIHSDRADYPENMKELPYVQWLKVWKVKRLGFACIGARWFVWSTKGVGLYAQRLKWWKRSIRSYTSKNALYEQNVLSSHGLHRSTFGDERLNYRVRNGIGWSLSLWFRSYKAFSLYEPNIWSYQVTNFAHPEGYIALWVKITNRKEIIKIKSSTN